jgi:hypothetical protein
MEFFSCFLVFKLFYCFYSLGWLGGLWGFLLGLLGFFLLLEDWWGGWERTVDGDVDGLLLFFFWEEIDGFLWFGLGDWLRDHFRGIILWWIILLIFDWDWFVNGILFIDDGLGLMMINNLFNGDIFLCDLIYDYILLVFLLFFICFLYNWISFFILLISHLYFIFI